VESGQTPKTSTPISILKPLRDNGKSIRVAEGLFDLNGSERLGTANAGWKGKK
jgi:hypothetical protein